MKVDDELLNEFAVESLEHLSDVESLLLMLESMEAGADADVINKVFRAVHSIKGAAGFLGLDVVESLSHRGEEVLNHLRCGKLTATSEVVNVLLQATDKLKTLIGALETSNQQDVTEHIDALTALLPSSTDGQDDNLVALENETVAVGGERTQLENQAAIPSAKTASTDVSECGIPAAIAVAHAKPSEPNAASESGQQVTDNTIRVDVSLLDKLMTRVGELVLARNQVLQAVTAGNETDLVGATQRLNLITTELQESVMKTRMQPIGTVWSKFPRLVRDVALLCGKQVRIEMEGRDTELDKTIIEAIKDPLMHIVRNSIDHGIETPDRRTLLGKSAEGCVFMRAYHEGGQVNIEISDDGAGINIERIKEKAIERGVISSEAALRLTDTEASALIFLPGFSTAEKISNVSGRGVGMDVVKTNIEKIGGTVDLQSTMGSGTTIKIKIPLTLAIIPALIVSNDGERFAIPQVNLLELVRLKREDGDSGIEHVQGAAVYRLRGRLLPLVYLRDLLKTQATSQESVDSVNIVVLRADDRQFGLVVDRINDTEEIVVKPLSQQLKGITHYSGATIMGDGRIALILDVIGLSHHAQLVSKNRDKFLAELQTRNSGEEGAAQTLLILGTGCGRRLALPISEVARLEKIPQSSVEHADGYEVVQYRGRILPLVRLAEILGMSSGSEPAERLNVVVYSEGTTSCGLVVDNILDIVNTNVQVSHRTMRNGLLGSAVIARHVTDLVDLSAVTRNLDLNPAN